MTGSMTEPMPCAQQWQLPPLLITEVPAVSENFRRRNLRLTLKLFMKCRRLQQCYASLVAQEFYTVPTLRPGLSCESVTLQFVAKLSARRVDVFRYVMVVKVRNSRAPSRSPTTMSLAKYVLGRAYVAAYVVVEIVEVLEIAGAASAASAAVAVAGPWPSGVPSCSVV